MEIEGLGVARVASIADTPANNNRPGGGMLRSSFVTASLASLLLATAGVSVSMAAGGPEVPNIGFVLYSKSHTPGTLNARWNFANKYSGPGLATGGPREGFAGRYHVRYFLDSGEFSDEYDLVIEKTGDFYSVSWLVDGKVRAVGVGMEIEDGLAVGWRRVAD